MTTITQRVSGQMTGTATEPPSLSDRIGQLEKQIADVHQTLGTAYERLIGQRPGVPATDAPQPIPTLLVRLSNAIGDLNEVSNLANAIAANL